MSKKLTMQEKARRLWIRALRSGKYGWGKRELHPNDGRYCCLGVLCELAIKHRIIKNYDPTAGTLNLYPKVIAWVGLEDDDGEFYNGSLVDLNDDASRNPFKHIARIIEKKPKGLFVEEQP